jgi:hypothetical protein
MTVLSDRFWLHVARTRIDPEDVARETKLPVEVVREEIARVTGHMPRSRWAWEEACRQLRSTWR